MKLGREEIELESKQSEHEIANNDLKKLEESFGKEGYVEGISDGADSIFQRDFDVGYNVGFESALVLGKLKGRLLTLKTLNNANPGEVAVLLVKPSRGQCQICSDSTLIREPIEKILSVQAAHNAEITNKIAEQCG